MTTKDIDMLESLLHANLGSNPFHAEVPQHLLAELFDFFSATRTQLNRYLLLKCALDSIAQQKCRCGELGEDECCASCLANIGLNQAMIDEGQEQ